MDSLCSHDEAKTLRPLLPSARPWETKRPRFVIAALLFSLLPLSAQRLLRPVALDKLGIPHGNYSGIAPLGGGRYAMVSDKAPHDGFYTLTLHIDTRNGKLKSVSDYEYHPSPITTPRDQEGVAWNGATLFICGEEDQQILEYRPDGTLTGRRLDIPARYCRDSIRSNYGFEALTFDGTHYVAIIENGPRMELLRFGTDLRLADATPYALDTPTSSSTGARTYAHGIVALCPLPDSRLAALEREIRITRRGFGSWCRCKLFAVSIEGSTANKELITEWRSRMTPVNKRLANYEGLCPGPTLDDGRQTLLLVSDSQNGTGRWIYRLHDYLRVVVLPRHKD